MSSNQNNNNNRPSKKMKSIAHRIVWLITKTKMKLYFKTDILIFVLLNMFWAYMKEIEVIGSFSFHRHRDLILQNGLITGLTYKVTSLGGELLMSVGFFGVASRIGALVLALYMLQLLGVLFSLPVVSGKAHKTLRPISDLAEKADELNKLAFSEDKYRLIEDAIEHVVPDENQYVYLHDKELLGVEQSVNRLIERLKDSYRQQARFVNDASHELRTPIAVIQGYAQMLERWGSTDEKVLDESIAAISNDADHMNRLVEQLLFLARGDSGKTVLAKEPVKLGELMQEIYEESFMIDETHPYRFRNSEEEIIIDADRTLLKQAVRVLVDNAAKYTNPGDEIILGVGRNDDNNPYLMVQDTGIGMTQADVEHMFERFYRADKARTYNGTGLGLSIAKWIVDRHGGYFEILSRTELGTRIMIIL